MDVVISEYNPSNQTEVKELVLKGLREFGFSYDPKLDSDLEDPSIYIKNGGAFFVLKEGEEIIGTVGVINKGEVAELKRMYMDSDFQNKGYGSKLFDKALEFCREKGFKKLEFETNKKFTKAHEFYKKRGCRVIWEEESSYYMDLILV